jgi:ribonuclease Z
MNVIFMGTSSAAGSVERDNTYLLLQNGENCWMIDVGGNPLGKLKQKSIPLDHIKGIILTHFHVDHIYGLPSLLWGMWIAKRTEALEIYCSALHENQLQDILNSYQVSQWPIQFNIRVHAFEWTEESTLLQQEQLTISTFPSLHVGATIGVHVKTGNKVLIYSADSRPNEWIRKQERIDVLIHEATAARGAMNVHTSLEDLIHFYPIDEIERVIAVHLTDHEPYEEILAQCSETVSAKIRLAHDMMTISI